MLKTCDDVECYVRTCQCDINIDRLLDCMVTSGSILIFSCYLVHHLVRNLCVELSQLREMRVLLK